MLEFNALSFSFPGNPLFENVSIHLKSGELAHISGNNGTGKSTLLQIVVGLIAPTSGTVRLSKDCAMEFLPAERNGHYLDLNAIENLRYWHRLRNKNCDTAELTQMLRTFKFPEIALSQNLSVRKYSTGMKRKLALVRALTSGANILVLDEPILGLDQTSVQIFAAQLGAFLRKGGACIMVSHEMKDLHTLVSQTILLGHRS